MPLATPPLIVEGFGANAGGAYITNPIPVPSQIGVAGNIASYNDGFPPDTMIPIASGGIDMRGPDMNGILFAATANIAALTGGQFYPFSATWAAANGGYGVGAVVVMANGAGLWMNTIANNTNNPDTAAPPSAGWVPLALGATNYTQLNGLTGGTVTLTLVQAASSVIQLNGTLTSNLTLVFPQWAQQWLIQNNTSGAYTVTASMPSGSTVIIPQAGLVPSLIVGQPNGILPIALAPTGSSGGGGVGTVLSTSLASPVGINTSLITVASLTGLVAGATYVLEWRGDLTTVSIGTLQSYVVPSVGSITAHGLGQTNSIDTNNSLIERCQNPCQSSVVAGVLGIPLSNNLRSSHQWAGSFSMPGGATAITYQHQLSGGSATWDTGASLILTRTA